MSWNLGLYRKMSYAYAEIIQLCLKDGDKVAPDGRPTIELLDVGFSLKDVAKDGVPLGLGRRVGRKPMAIDGFQNLAGHAYPEVALATGPFLERFADKTVDGHPYFQGAYGPRMADGLNWCEQMLRRDPLTRRAVVTIWDNQRDIASDFKDRPCTTQLQFLIREGRLDMYASMRANDVWTGLAYDPWQFGQVLQAMAHVLRIPVGIYHHRATSMHIYEADLDKFLGMKPGYNRRETSGPDWGALPKDAYPSIGAVQRAFRLIGDAKAYGRPYSPQNLVEQWYWDILESVDPVSGASYQLPLWGDCDD